MVTPYRAGTRAEDAASEALVVSCSDRRFQAVVREFLTVHLGLKYWDAVTVPGGAYVLASPLAGTAGTEMTTFLMNLSKPPRIILLSHEGCGRYQALFGGQAHLPPGLLKNQQIRDLTTASAAMRRAHPRAAVEAYFVARSDDGTVQFEPIAG